MTCPARAKMIQVRRRNAGEDGCHFCMQPWQLRLGKASTNRKFVSCPPGRTLLVGLRRRIVRREDARVLGIKSSTAASGFLNRGAPPVLAPSGIHPEVGKLQGTWYLHMIDTSA